MPCIKRLFSGCLPGERGGILCQKDYFQLMSRYQADGFRILVIAHLLPMARLGTLEEVALRSKWPARMEGGKEPRKAQVQDGHGPGAGGRCTSILAAGAAMGALRLGRSRSSTYTIATLSLFWGTKVFTAMPRWATRTTTCLSPARVRPEAVRPTSWDTAGNSTMKFLGVEIGE